MMAAADLSEFRKQRICFSFLCKIGNRCQRHIDMRVSVMHVVKIQFGAQGRVRWPGKKVQTAIESQNGITLFNDRWNRGKHEYIVVTGTSGNAAKFLNRITNTCIQVN